ncbi:MAG: TIR domain-containing protein [Desulfuromonadaceae bacterium]|nr:TIR domain-containing protein [Desulfuromonadaceae bacterium]
MEQIPPKLFISYSWSTPEHEQWVLTLATELTDAGVDVVLDKWDLKEGNDAHAFMEKMVTDPEIKKVAIICDKLYSEKANGRSGGVGTETQIISPEIYNKQNQNKFVAVVVERTEDGKPCLPVYYKSRIYIDFSDPDAYAIRYEELLRWVYDKPLYVKPKIGSMPSFLSETDQLSLGTTVKQKRAIESIKSGKDYAKGAIEEYLETIVKNLEAFRITQNEQEFDDLVVDNIEKFLPYRNEAIEVFLAIAQYRDSIDGGEQLHRFFERLIPYMYCPKEARGYSDWDFDNFKYIIHELFLYALTALIRYEKYDGARYLIQQYYYVERNADHGREVMVSFTVFRNYLKSIERRNERQKLGRLSLRADLLEQRCKVSGLKFHEVMQTDFILYLRSCLTSIKDNKQQNWWPETLIYADRHYAAFEIFARCQSVKYFERVKTLLDIDTKNDLAPIFEAFDKKELRVPSWDYETLNVKTLSGYDKLCIRP